MAGLEERIDQDIKAALLAGDKSKATVLRGLKASLLNVKVAEGKRETGLTDDVVLNVLAKEAKKRQESADLYQQAGDQARTDQELSEKAIIEVYLPAQLSEAELADLIDEVIKTTAASGPQAMGQVIGQVKAQAGPAADGATVARLVKEKLQ